MTKNPNPKNANNSLITFTSGFALGSLLTYFTTPKGKKAWKRLAKEWDKARDYLFEQGLIKDKDISLDEFRNKYFKDLNDSFLGLKGSFEDLVEKTEQIKQTKNKKRKKRRAYKKKNQFKGV